MAEHPKAEQEHKQEDDERTDPAFVLPPRMPEMGALAPLMMDPSISEIMVNDLRNVMIEKEGKLTHAGFSITSIEELNRLVRAILDFSGRILTPEHPYVDLMLPDGSRVNIVGPPVTVLGPSLTIRKVPARSLSLEELMNAGAMDRRIAHFLSVCVSGRLNILVCGGTGSGKTTLLNALLAYVPRSERLVTIEDTPELRIAHVNSVKMQTKLGTPSSPPITARDLLANSLRMRPDRIIIGECRRAEAFDMLQAMNTGHDGSMTTIHANSPRDALSRLETLCMMANLDLPLLAIRRQIVSAIDLIIQIRRFRDGSRRVASVAEVTGIEGDMITLQDLFTFDDGRFRSFGLVPSFVEKLKSQGVEFPANYFA